jgi:sugar phosphate isomerase/epimerase
MSKSNVRGRAADRKSASQGEHGDIQIRTGIQLHTLRDLDASLPETIRRVGEAGFDGVELSGTLEDANLDALSAALSDAGVEAMSGHVDQSALESDFEGVVERYRKVGCDRIAIPHLGVEHVVTDRAVRDTADEYARLGARLADRGIQLYYHNVPHDLRPHFREDRLGAVLGLGPIPEVLGDRATGLLDSVTSVDPNDIADRTALGQIYARTVGRSLRFEIDVGSVTMEGYNPDDVLDLVGDRLDLIHYTEGADVDATLRAARRNDVSWVIYEDDHPDNPAAALRRGTEALVKD